ncbi:hypothetical protein KNE206_54320 [Kitasatospora sp. NE20-6]
MPADGFALAKAGPSSLISLCFSFAWISDSARNWFSTWAGTLNFGNVWILPSNTVTVPIQANADWWYAAEIWAPFGGGRTRVSRSGGSR